MLVTDASGATFTHLAGWMQGSHPATARTAMNNIKAVSTPRSGRRAVCAIVLAMLAAASIDAARAEDPATPAPVAAPSSEPAAGPVASPADPKPEPPLSSAAPPSPAVAPDAAPVEVKTPVETPAAAPAAPLPVPAASGPTPPAADTLPTAATAKPDAAPVEAKAPVETPAAAAPAAPPAPAASGSPPPAAGTSPTTATATPASPDASPNAAVQTAPVSASVEVSPPTVVPQPPPPASTAPVAATATPAPGAVKPIEGGAAAAELRFATTAAGGYAKAQKLAILDPYAEKSGHKLNATSAADDAALLSALATSDVVEMDGNAAELACAVGELLPISAERLVKASDGSEAKDDFLAGGLTRCGVPSVVWSSLIIFDRTRFGKNRPATLADVFDAARFPGKRVFRKGPRRLLELALLADGVKPDEVYATLAQEAGVERALTKLEAIRPHLLLVDEPGEAIRLIEDGRATFGAVYNGRAYQEIAVNGRPLAQIWDGQIYEFNVWAVTKGARDTAAAEGFIAFATDPERLAAQARLLPYGPSRRSAVALVGRQPVLKIALDGYLPTAPANFGRALRFDAAFWRLHEKALSERLEAWLSKAPPSPPPRAAGKRPPGAGSYKPSSVRPPRRVDGSG